MHPAASSFGEYFQFFPAEMYHQQQLLLLQEEGTLEAVLWQPVTAPAPAERGEPGNDGAPGPGGAVVGAARKRPFRTDRHSKIRTAQGVRDRRMRLSVGVAREFFALQDLLGFDKASKTVEWLLTQSKPAIDRLADGTPGAAAAAAGPSKEKGEGATSSGTGCFEDAREEEHDVRDLMKGIGGEGELDWFMSEAAAIGHPMEGLD
ncbi:hypothetical protein CFC21_020736 [Triticum aestivum]|uniref:TCP domain-containing protein n=3 Tax=Triticum TaxID=4564 RepID=A0A9R1PAU8_TRITD|nr:transcription factor TEOSINTE BRANCHED 1-like [Triticum dicoccoides]XP_044318870.1 transcription factor TEOSINTE BRANCHED 1-like [Triticum aestivum]KAF7005626.1 hypothetical protein CFC21_020736 [Triticum aestivum]VAH40077.1 unnamed protein product [Triticum turgidum subsp. durum]